MRRLSFIISAMAVILITACASNTKYYTVNNKSDITINGKTIVVSFDEIVKYAPAVKQGDAVVAVKEDGTILPSQNDDIDGDGIWDELAFLVDVNAKSSENITFKIVAPEELTKFPQKTNVRFGEKNEPYNEIESARRLASDDSPAIQAIFQMEGPAWENDIVGFRNYYDARNGIDIYGKKTNKMVLDNVGIRGQKYHELDSWGMDILKVGNSLGAGAIAIKIGDELFRVGPCEEGNYRLITEGPVRAMFELSFKGFKAGERSYDIVHRITINAGDHFYQSKVWVEGLKGDESLVTGIVDKHELAVQAIETDDFRIFATHGAQAYKGEMLGMALIVDKNDFISQYAAPKTGEGIVETHLVEIKPAQPAEYAFVAGWEHQDKQFESNEFFMEICKLSVER